MLIDFYYFLKSNCLTDQKRKENQIILGAKTVQFKRINNELGFGKISLPSPTVAI
jgi:hypothetical protein